MTYHSSVTITLISVLILLCFPDCSADLIPVKDAAAKAITARQVIQQQQEYYQQYLSSSAVQQFLREFLDDPLLKGDANNGSISKSLCVNQTLDFLEDIMLGEPTAIFTLMGVLDASGKPAPGLFKGNYKWLGSFKECTQINYQSVTNQNVTHKNVTQHTLKGQYCTAQLHNETNNMLNDPWSDLGKLVYAIQLGLCMPDTCSNEEVGILLSKGLSKLGVHQLKANVTCLPNKLSYDAPAIAVICLLSIFGCILLAASLYDVWVYQPYMLHAETKAGELINDTEEQSGEDSPLLGRQKPFISQPVQPGVAVRLLLSFSMYTNGAKILDTSSKGGIIPVIHGVRFLSLSWVILGHTLAFLMGSAGNMADFLVDAKQWYYEIIFNGTVAVDTFFLLSGLLVSYLLLQQLGDKEKPWKNNWLMYYFHRFWRLTPAMMLVLGTYTALFGYWGAGPNWPYKSIDHATCTRYWWRNLFYIQNLFDASEMCMGWSWYLAIDMQFYILSPLLVLPYLRSKWLGLGVTGVFLLVQSVTTIVIVVRDHSISSMAGLMAALLSGNQDILANVGKFMDDLYFKPWIRFGPYGVGIIAGYIMYATKRKLQIHWLLAVLGWCVAAAVALAVVFGTYEPAQGHLMTRAGSAMYNAFHSSAWAAAVAWLIIACDSGYGGFVNQFLCWKAFVPLSRLTYMAYLIHPIIMYWFYFNQQTVIYYSGLNIFYFYLGHLVFSYSIAAIVSLAFESPMMGLEKVIFNRERRA